MSALVDRADTIAARRVGAQSDLRAQRRQHIVMAAARAIEEHGTNAALALVADQAGLARPHVYRHFESKDDLDQEVARYAARALSEWIRPTLTARGTPPVVIRGIISRVVSWAAEHPNLYRFRVRLGPSPALTELAETAHAYLRAAGSDVLMPQQAMASVVGMVDISILWWFDHREEFAADDLIERLTPQVWLVLSDALEHQGRPLDPQRELTPT